MRGTSEELNRLREMYSQGARICLVQMKDERHPVPPWTTGTVRCVDDAGTIHVDWDNSSTLGLIPGIDTWNRLIQVKRSDWERMERKHKDYCTRSIHDPDIRVCFAGMLEKGGGTRLLFEHRHFELV